MSDEQNTAPRKPGGIYEHFCEHPGCKKDGGWGFATGKQTPHWFCYEHRAEGRKYTAQGGSTDAPYP
ncbi:hypothetical protein [Aminobacter aminovorans]|nr:hypothetical protein [Aminobacter aminovorans]MBB3705080.1 hypothetical protein [Aminobacter aminovorans]